MEEKLDGFSKEKKTPGNHIKHTPKNWESQTPKCLTVVGSPGHQELGGVAGGWISRGRDSERPLAAAVCSPLLPVAD